MIWHSTAQHSTAQHGRGIAPQGIVEQAIAQQDIAFKVSQQMLIACPWHVIAQAETYRRTLHAIAKQSNAYQANLGMSQIVSVLYALSLHFNRVIDIFCRLNVTCV